jgi:hypothetical protein
VSFPGGNQVTTTPSGKDIATQICNQPIGSVAADIVALQNQFQAAVKGAGPSANPGFVGETLENAGNMLAPNYKSPRSWQMNAGIQHEFGKGTVVSADYIRNVSLRFLLGVDTNHVGDARFLNKTAAVNAISNTNGAFNCPANASAASINCAITAGATIADYANFGLDSGNSALGGQPSIAAFVDPSGSNDDPVNGCPFCAPAFGGINPFYGQNTMYFPVGRSVYNALQISVRQRIVSNPFGMMPFVHGINAQFSYTLSRFNSMATDQDFLNSTADQINPSNFFGPTSFDRTHEFSFGTIVTLPKSVQVSFIGHFNSPLPTTLELENQSRPGEIFQTDLNGDGAFGPNGFGDIIPGTNIGSYGRSVSANSLGSVITNYNNNVAGKLTPAGQALVTAGLFTPAQLSSLGAVADTLAPAQTGTLYANDWLRAFDMRFSVPISITEHVKLEPSVSIFNIFNFANFAISPSTRVNGILSSSTPNGSTYSDLDALRAGLGSGVFSQGAPRQLEYGLRVTF